MLCVPILERTGWPQIAGRCARKNFQRSRPRAILCSRCCALKLRSELSVPDAPSFFGREGRLATEYKVHGRDELARSGSGSYGLLAGVVIPSSNSRPLTPNAPSFLAREAKASCGVQSTLLRRASLVRVCMRSSPQRWRALELRSERLKPCPFRSTGEDEQGSRSKVLCFSGSSQRDRAKCSHRP